MDSIDSEIDESPIKVSSCVCEKLRFIASSIGKNLESIIPEYIRELSMIKSKNPKDAPETLIDKTIDFIKKRYTKQTYTTHRNEEYTGVNYYSQPNYSKSNVYNKPR